MKKKITTLFLSSLITTSITTNIYAMKAQRTKCMQNYIEQLQAALIVDNATGNLQILPRCEKKLVQPDYPLHQAAGNGNLAEVKTIIAAGLIPIDTPNKKNQTALMYATNSIRKEIVLILLEAGADPLRSYPQNQSALFYATKTLQELVQNKLPTTFYTALVKLWTEKYHSPKEQMCEQAIQANAASTNTDQIPEPSQDDHDFDLCLLNSSEEEDPEIVNLTELEKPAAISAHDLQNLPPSPHAAALALQSAQNARLEIINTFDQLI